MLSENFCLTLPSNACTDIFPDNSGGFYKTNLPQELRLDSSNWEVGLSEITYVSNSWDNVREGENVIHLTVETAETLEHINHLERYSIFGEAKLEQILFAKRLMPKDLIYKISLEINHDEGGVTNTGVYNI